MCVSGGNDFKGCDKYSSLLVLLEFDLCFLVLFWLWSSCGIKRWHTILSGLK